MDVSEVRRRLRAAIESARRHAQERRARSDQAAREYAELLAARVAPVFQTVASALVAEGYRFKVFTPADSIRLASESSADDFIELSLDSTVDPPAVMGRISRGRGRRLVITERAVKEDVAIEHLSEEDVLAFLMAELTPFLER
jgi:hypothetical protein